MSRVRAKGSGMEKTFARGLKGRRIRFTKNCKKVFGCPDFVIRDQKIAIFCDSHFWHGYNWKTRKDDFKSNKKFWLKKIRANILRDKMVNKTLKKAGWKVFRFWEHQIKNNLEHCLDKLGQKC
jgi:DNA mismatch endonuclease Vsr